MCLVGDRVIVRGANLKYDTRLTNCIFRVDFVRISIVIIVKKHSVACGVKRLVLVNPGTPASGLTTMIQINLLLLKKRR